MKKHLLLLSILALFTINSKAQTEYDWEIVYEKTGYVLNTIDFWDHKHAIAMGNNGVVLRTENAGEWWSDYSDSKLGNITLLDVSNKDTAFASDGKRVFRTFDGGKNWEFVFKTFHSINDLRAEFHTISSIAVSCDSATIFLSNDFGDHWFKKNVNQKLYPEEHIYSNNVGMYNGDSAYAMKTSWFHRRITVDNFDSWHDNTNYGTGKRIIKVHSFCDHIRNIFGIYNWIQFEDNTFMVETSGGVGLACETAKEKINGLDGYPFYLNKNSKTPTFAVGDNGYIMKHKGSNFEEMVDDESSPTTNDLNWIDMSSAVYWSALQKDWRFHSDTLTYIAVGDGVIIRKRFNWEPDPVSINKGQTKSLSAYVYPNPSNGTIKVGIPNNDQLAQIRVIGIDGKEVAYHSGVSNIFEISGLAKGVFTVKIESEQGICFKKLVVQ